MTGADVPVLTHHVPVLTHHVPVPHHHLLAMTNSVRLVCHQVKVGALVPFMLMIPCGTVKVVVQLAHAAHSTIHHGFQGKQLPQSTNADLEVRLCSLQDASIENTPIELIEIYVK